MIIDDIYNILSPVIQNTYDITVYIDATPETINTPFIVIRMVAGAIPTHIRERRLEIRIVQDITAYDQVNYEDIYSTINDLLVYNMQPIESIYAIREAWDVVSLPTTIWTIEHVKDYSVYSINTQFLSNS